MEVTLFLVVNKPTAVALIPPLGAVVSPMVGGSVNPDPSFNRLIVSRKNFKRYLWLCSNLQEIRKSI